MSERNEKLAAMLAADAPAARDLGFEIAVMARIEQRRFRRELARNLVLAAGAALLLALLAPQLDWAAAWAARIDLSQLTGNTMLMLTLVIAGFAAWHYRPAER